MLDKLLVVAGIGGSLYGKWLLRRLISGVIAIACLGFLTVCIVSALIFGCFYAGYSTLLNAGVTETAALVMLGVAGLIIIAALVVAIIICIRRLEKLPQRLLRQAPVMGKATNVVEGFLDGLLARY